MDCAVNIVEVLADGKYKLNEGILRSIISSAIDCDVIELISIVGPKVSGKSLLMNSLVKYLESNEKQFWQKDCLIKNNEGFKNDFQKKRPVIQMWPKPFIIEKDGFKIGVFLIDTSYVIGLDVPTWSTDLVKDMIGFILNISSTIIYNTKHFSAHNISQFTDFVKAIHSSEGNIDSNRRLICLIRNWKPVDTPYPERYEFGSVDSQRYLNKYNPKSIELKEYFGDFEAYLLPNPFGCAQHSSIDFNLFSNDFKIHLQNLFESKLLNIIEMPFKKKSNKCLNPKEILQYFRYYFNKMNGELDSTNCGLNLINTFFDGSNDNLNRNQQTLGSTSLEKHLQPVLEESEESDPKTIVSNVFGCEDNKCLPLSSNTQTIEENNQLGNSTQTEESADQMDSDNNNDESSVINYSNDTKNIEMITISSHDSVDMTQDIDKGIGTEAQQNITETLTHVNNNIEESKENLNEKVLFQYCEDLLKQFKEKVEKRIHSKYLYQNYYQNYLNQNSVSFENQKKEILNFFNKKYEKKNELIGKYRENLLENINQLNDTFKKIVEKEMLEKNFNECLIVYKNRKYSTQCKDIANHCFDNKVKELHKINANVVKGFKTKLNKDLDLSEDKYKEVFKIINKYLKEWEQLFKSERYVEEYVLLQKHSTFKTLIINSLQNMDLNQLIDKLIDITFEEIKIQNLKIKEFEKQLVEVVKSHVIKMFWIRYEHEFKTRFFSITEMMKMFEKLLECTTSTLGNACDFKSHQKALINELNESLRHDLKEMFTEKRLQFLKESTEVKQLIERSEKESINLYLNEITKRMSVTTSFKSQEFKSLSTTLREQALKHNETLLLAINSKLSKEFFNFCLNSNINKINTQIERNEKIFYSKHNFKEPVVESNCCSFAVHFGKKYLFAAIYDNEFKVISDKNNDIQRPNCIAFSDDILFGNEALNYYQTQNQSFNLDFDIKDLLLKEKSDLSDEELKSYPFEFNELMKTKVQKNQSYELCIESMIALQVLDIKSEAEKQFGCDITNSVFIVPSNFTIRKRNAFKNVAKIAGLESVNIISELTAAAIGYSNEVQTNTETNVLFVAINDFECDAAVCRLNGKQIVYLGYCYQDLISSEKNWSKTILKTVATWIWPDDSEQNKIIEKNIEKLLNTLLKVTKMNKKSISDVVVLGNSLILTEIQRQINNYLGKSLTLSNPIDIMVKGSALLAKQLNEKNLNSRFDIKEVTFHKMEVQCEGRLSNSYKKTIIEVSTQLNGSYIVMMDQIYENDLPIKINILVDNSLVSLFEIQSLPYNYINKLQGYNFKNYLYFEFYNFGIFKVTSNLMSTTGIEANNKLIEINLGLSHTHLENEKRIIKLIEENSKEKKTSAQRKCANDNPRKELEDLYFEIKLRFKNNTELGRLKKKRIEEELNKTEPLLKTDNTDIKALKEQKTCLENMVKTLKI